MDIDNKQILKSYLSNLQVNVVLAGFSNVDSNWQDIDYTPDYNKFYLLKSGEGWLKIGDCEYSPKPGQLFLMPSGLKQSYSTISDNTFTKYWCHFTAKIGDMNIFDIIKLPDFIETSGNELPESIFKELLKNYNGIEITSSLMLKSSILRLISYYIDNCDVQITNLSKTATTEKLSLVMQYVESNLNRNITIEELAGLVYLHPNYFIRLFKKNFGISPIHYINKRRIEEAQQLLINSGLSVSEICNIVGISDIYYLSRLFKEYTGFSPSAFRQLNKKSNTTG
jgi:AraC family transcriptional regulator of arabinose operon